MKTSEFEEQFTAWLDGKLSPEDAAIFEQEMRDRGFNPELERSAASRTAALLRDHSQTPRIANADFFNHQIRHRIESSLDESAPVPSRQPSWLGIPWLAWAGAASLLIAAALFKGLIPIGGGSLAERSTYFATVVDARTFENTVSASTVYNPKDNVTVLWLDGLDYLPADFVVQ